MKTRFIFILIGATLLACQAKQTQTNFKPGGLEHGFVPPPVLNESMQNLKRDLIVLQPYIFDRSKFNNKKNQAFLSKSIHDLNINSQNVKHDPILRSKDPTARFVAAQFAGEIREIDENFQAGWQDYSRSQLIKVTSFCLECHTRIKDGVEVSLNKSVEPYVNTLTVKDQIEFMIAFRQFELAYKIALKEMKISVESQSNLDDVSHLGLMIAVRYMQDKEKAQALLTALNLNPKTPIFLKAQALGWKKSLDQWNSGASLSNLPEIRILLKNRSSEIEEMRAIPALLRLLTGDLTDDQLGETLLLTGQSYEALGSVSGLALNENYYESCIRRVPNSKWSKQCFTNYSNSVTASFTGSAGTKFPRDIKIKLHQLKQIAE